MLILTLNCGSSSIKYMVYNWKKRAVLCRGLVERIIIGDTSITHKTYNGKQIKKKLKCSNHREAIKIIYKTIGAKIINRIDAVGHRVVHGGENFTKSVLINNRIIKTFKELFDLAPLHNPPNVFGIEAARELLPDIPHMAVMGTAFHQTIPEHCYIYALPYTWYEKYSIRRYGFHGTSHLYVSKRAAVLLGRKPNQTNLITCHIGNGVSFTAIKNGVAYDHSMGFTPLEGLVMGTRCGDIDPAIVPFMIKAENLSPGEIDAILNRKSGVLGISGKYVDRRDIMKAIKRGEHRAKLAFEIEAYRIRKYIGAYYTSLGRVDAIVFTAGVGERSWETREKALEGLENLGIIIDKKNNRKATSGDIESEISSPGSKVKVFVIPTNEELVIVEDTVAILEKRYNVHTKFKYSFE